MGKDKETTDKAVVLAANSSWNLVNFRGNIIVALQRQGFRIVAIAPRDSHTGQLQAMGVEYHPLEFRSAGISPLDDARLLLRYIALLRAIRPAAFLGFTIKPNVYGSLAARLLGIPAINNVSGLGTAFIKQGMITRVATFLYRQAFRRSATVFFQNDEDRRQFVAAGMVAAGQSRLLPGSGVDLDRFAPTPPPSGKPFCFLLIGRLLWDKGVQEYVDAARIVKRRHPDARFQILGFADVDNRTAVPRATLDRWIGEGLIEHLGATDDVRPYIAASDCVVLPSYREGLPRSLLEASAMARPIVATDVPGVRDVVDDRVTGLLCQVRSAASLAEAMLAMIALSPAERSAMGQAGRDRVERRFGIGEVTRRYLDAIGDALSHPDRDWGVRGSVMTFLSRIFGAVDARPAPRGAEGYRAYAVGDVHGRLDLLDQLLAKIEADIAGRAPSQNLVVFLGDLIDRGPQSSGVVERLRTWQPSDATPIFLCGNHEEVLLRVLAGEPTILADWLRFGGAECLASYGLSPALLMQQSEQEALAEIKAAIPPEHQAFLADFADTFRFGDYLFVHAGIRPGVEVAAQAKMDLRWIREQFLDDPTDHGYVVVHGHTISAGVEERANRIGIDTGAYRTGRLTAVAIEGAQRWYLDTTPAD